MVWTRGGVNVVNETERMLARDRLCGIYSTMQFKGVASYGMEYIIYIIYYISNSSAMYNIDSGAGAYHFFEQQV